MSAVFLIDVGHRHCIKHVDKVDSLSVSASAGFVSDSPQATIQSPYALFDVVNSVVNQARDDNQCVWQC